MAALHQSTLCGFHAIPKGREASSFHISKNTEASLQAGLASCPPRGRGSIDFRFTGPQSCVKVKWPERESRIANALPLCRFLLRLECIFSLEFLNLRAQLFHHFLQVFNGWNFRL